MILYPTETTYGLGVNPFDEVELGKIYEVKGRNRSKAVSWLVRSVDDIERYAQLSPLARRIADRHLPGPLTIVLPTLDGDELRAFRISSDPAAQQLIEQFMAEHDVPLTCTSANLSGQPTLATPQQIMQQLSANVGAIDRVIDDGPRGAQPSTVVKVTDDKLEILRQGSTELASDI
jgi:tRNA threonylcarbamoyl adenosine modification protein (Sua5/YciO/YrdC/YwlC family)